MGDRVACLSEMAARLDTACVVGEGDAEVSVVGIGQDGDLDRGTEQEVYVQEEEQVYVLGGVGEYLCPQGNNHVIEEKGGAHHEKDGKKGYDGLGYHMVQCRAPQHLKSLGSPLGWEALVGFGSY